MSIRQHQRVRTMPTHRVPPDILQRNIIVDIDERNVVNVVVADMSAYGLTDSSANLSYVVDQEAAEQYLNCQVSNGHITCSFQTHYGIFQYRNHN